MTDSHQSNLPEEVRGTRSLVLSHLAREKWLTSDQLRRLCSVSYSGMTRLLNRMLKDKLIRVHKLGQNDPLFFFLPGTKAPTEKYHHERSCAELYVACEITGLLTEWGTPERFEDYREYVKLGLLPDRISILDNTLIFWEVDEGSENYETVSDKIPRYVSLSRKHPAHRFHVIFTTQDCYRSKNAKRVLRQSARARAKRILLDLMEFKRGNQLLVGQLSEIVKDPLGRVFASPLNPESFVSLDDMRVKPESTH